MFARIGGEEFAVLLQNVGTEQAALIADFFREEVERAKFPYNPASGKVTVSIGVASASSNFSTTESLFEAADQALYQAKQNGRNQIAVHQGNSNETIHLNFHFNYPYWRRIFHFPSTRT